VPGTSLASDGSVAARRTYYAYLLRFAGNGSTYCWRILHATGAALCMESCCLAPALASILRHSGAGHSALLSTKNALSLLLPCCYASCSCCIPPSSSAGEECFKTCGREKTCVPQKEQAPQSKRMSLHHCCAACSYLSRGLEPACWALALHIRLCTSALRISGLSFATMAAANK